MSVYVRALCGGPCTDVCMGVDNYHVMIWGDGHVIITCVGTPRWRSFCCPVHTSRERTCAVCVRCVCMCLTEMPT